MSLPTRARIDLRFPSAIPVLEWPRIGIPPRESDRPPPHYRALRIGGKLASVSARPRLAHQLPESIYEPTSGANSPDPAQDSKVSD